MKGIQRRLWDPERNVHIPPPHSLLDHYARIFTILFMPPPPPPRAFFPPWMYHQGCDLTKVKIPHKSWQMRTKPPEPSGFTNSPHPHKHETWGLDTIQATSFFPWWLLLFFQEDFEAKGDLSKILKSRKNLRNRRPESSEQWRRS